MRRQKPAQTRSQRRAHGSCPCAGAIRSMNTSSSEASTRLPGAAPASSRYGAIAASSAARSRPETCRLVPNGATMSTPGRCASSAASCGELCAGHRRRWRDAGCCDHLVDRAVRQQLAIGDVGDLVAALGLVHVVGRDQHGEAVARRARGSRPRTRAAPWDRRRRSARRAAAAAARAGCRRRAPAAASSRRTARRRAGPRGRSRPSRSIIVARRLAPASAGRRCGRRTPGSPAPTGPGRG